MQNKIIKYLVTIAALLAVIFLLQNINWLPSFSNPFKSKELVIEETPVLIKDIKNLAQLITLSMYHEVVVDSSRPKNLPSFPGLRPVPDKIVLIAKGRIYAGIDLTKLSENSITVIKDSVSMHLPHAQILSAIINPSDFETFTEVGNWSEEAVRRIKIKARQKIIARALQIDILKKADSKAKAVMENFLLSTGFKKVTVSF